MLKCGGNRHGEHFLVVPRSGRGRHGGLLFATTRFTGGAYQRFWRGIGSATIQSRLLGGHGRFIEIFLSGGNCRLGAEVRSCVFVEC